MAKKLQVIMMDEYGESMTVTDPVAVIVCEKTGKKNPVVRTVSIVDGKYIFHYDLDMSPDDMKEALKRLRDRKYKKKTDAQKLSAKLEGKTFDMAVVGELIRKMNESISPDKP